MANPFGITEVDVPGALSLYDQTKRARLADMLTARKVQQEDAEIERQGRLRDVYSRVQNPAASFPPAGAAAPQASLPSSPAGQPQIPSTWLQANQGLISEMMALDAKEAFELQNQLSQMDEAQIKRMGEINKTFAATGQWLLQFPENERRARLAEVAPELARGEAASFEEYKYMTGEILGLASAERMLLDAAERLEKGAEGHDRAH